MLIALLLTSCLFRENCFKPTNSVKAISLSLILTISTLIWQGRDPVRTFSLFILLALAVYGAVLALLFIEDAGSKNLGLACIRETR